MTRRRTTPFMIKNLMRDRRFAFIDSRSDFRAVMDEEGLRKLRQVFTHPYSVLDAPEQEIARRLVEHGLAGSEEELLEYGPPRERTGSALSRVEIELTKSCNLACRHCFTRKTRDRFDVARLEENLESLDELGVVEVILNGGEIFLHPEIDRVLELVRDRFKIILFTNGTVEGCVDRIDAVGVARVNVSLDGFADSHDHLRGEGAHARTVGAIRALVERGVRVQVNSVVYEKNVLGLDDFIRFCRDDLGVCGIKLSTIYPMGSALDHPELFEDSHATLRREVYEKYLREDLPGLPGENHLPCLAGITKLFIAASSNVYPCRLFEDSQFLMGSLADDSLAGVYRAFLERPSLFTRFSVDELESCRTCAALARCKTGCRARARLCDGDVRAADTFSCRHFLDPERDPTPSMR